MKAAVIAAIVAVLVTAGGAFAASPHKQPTSFTLKGQILTVYPGVTQHEQVDCPGIGSLLAGGYEVFPLANTVFNVAVPIDRPNGNGWLVAVTNRSSSPISFQVYALCETT